MNLIILNSDFETLGQIGAYQTLIWTRRYYEPGVFEIYAATEYFPLMNEGKYLYRSDRTELGVIDQVVYTRDEQGIEQALCKGSFAESLLNTRVIPKQVSYDITPQSTAWQLVRKNLVSPTDADRAISRIQQGTLAAVGSAVETSSTGDRVGDRAYEILRAYGASLRLRYDYLNDKLIFDVWKGLDRTDSQTTNSWAIFSDDFFNVRTARYERDETDYVNYAYVAGAGEGSARTVVEVDGRTDPDEERRELYVDARDLQLTYLDEDGQSHTYTTAEYEALLRQRGAEALAEYSKKINVESGIDPRANLIYLEDFDLGDLCVYRNRPLGIETQQRIIELVETYEGSGLTIDVNFGDGLVTSIKQLIRRETR